MKKFIIGLMVFVLIGIAGGAAFYVQNQNVKQVEVPLVDPPVIQKEEKKEEKKKQEHKHIRIWPFVNIKEDKVQVSISEAEEVKNKNKHFHFWPWNHNHKG
jgi:uncharacterized protein YxeA